ncbi:trypsin-like peptidase domain-containing protein [Actibacterium sp. MT2.3-13A]|uniref:S1C family serine protease n=1 Tax=Actibacterium sp. MT2.3-13A TaxID=2828332 RepID=UPI001BAAC5A4|nr:trypsin-like peptidase domain-containing protein [Actibacterium sp. MT2.3-13A]
MPNFVSCLRGLTLALLAGGAVQAAEPDCALPESDLFTKVEDKVVEIFTIAVNPFRVVGRITARGGSGYLLDGGYVATNYHVVADANTLAILVDDRAHDVQIVGVDPTLDIAVLRPWPPIGDGGGLPFAEDGAARIGQRAYAVGFPLGLGKSLSAGIVSGESRVLPMTTSSWLSPYIQTDAAISQGNSGGPLVDSCGRLIGMITAAISREGAENLGFAIPVGVLRPALTELIEKGKVSRPWHGLYGQIATPPVLMMLGIPQEGWEANTGFLVETVEPGSAADRAGLRGGSWPVMWGGNEILLGGDIILEVNGQRIVTRRQALDIVRDLKVGQRVDIVYMRDGARREATVLLEERPLLLEELSIYREHR